jgi:hypothetical protein
MLCLSNISIILVILSQSKSLDFEILIVAFSLISFSRINDDDNDELIDENPIPDVTDYGFLFPKYICWNSSLDITTTLASSFFSYFPLGMNEFKSVLALDVTFCYAISCCCCFNKA